MNWKRQLLFIIGLTCLCSSIGIAQVTVAAGTGSVSGRVLVEGKPIPKVRLALARGATGYFAASNAMRSESDADGRYKFSGLTAGTYSISPLNSVYVWGRPGEAANTISLGDGEQATDVDLVMKRGGVVTGKVTDADGNPVVDRFVQIERADGPMSSIPFGMQSPMEFNTDDRGVYRYYGVPSGRYRVSCGDGEGSFRQGNVGRSYPRTFHPDVESQALATVIEVTEGNETSGVDIRLSPAVKTYMITGRTIDADTQEPVGGLSITLDMPAGNGRGPQYGGRFNATLTGDFVLAGVRPGRWRISADNPFLAQGAAANGYSDPVFVEVQDENVSGVEIRIRKGGSITGVAMLEGSANAPSAPKLSDQRLMAYVQPEGMNPVISSPLRPSPIAPDGSFRIDGLRAGRATLMVPSSPGAIGLRLIRTERNGQLVANGIEIGPGENVTGVRLVFAVASSNIVGHVAVTGGALPPGTPMVVMARSVAGGVSSSARVDARGDFAIERMPAGAYELEARPILPQQGGAQPTLGTSVKQTVSVADGETAKVTLTFALKAP